MGKIRVPNLRVLAANVAAVAALPYAPVDDGQLIVGRTLAANESLFEQSHFNEPLTTYALGWRDPDNTGELLDRIIPATQTGHWFNYLEHNNAEAFLSDGDDDLRAIGSDFKETKSSGTKHAAQLENRGLTTVIDADELIDNPQREQQEVARLMARLSRNSLRRGVALIDAASTNADKTWSETSNPDADARTMLRTAADTSGVRPNLVVYGESAWDARMSAYEEQNNSGATAQLAKDPARLAAYLRVNRVEAIDARYQSSASAKSAIVGSKVYAYQARQGLSTEDPSNIKRFWAPCKAVGNLPGGMAVRVFRVQTGKLIRITVEKYELIKITSLLGIRKLTVTAA